MPDQVRHDRFSSASRLHRERQGVEQAALPRSARAFDFQDPELGAGAARGGEAAAPAAGGEHAVAGNENRDRVAPQSGADGLGGAGRADLAGDLAVGADLAAWDAERRLPDLALELRRGGEIERDGAEIDLFPAEHAHHQGGRFGDEGGRLRFGGAGPAALDAAPQRRLVLVRERGTYDKAAAPQEGAAAYRRFEKDEAGGLIRSRRRCWCCAAGRRR